MSTFFDAAAYVRRRDNDRFLTALFAPDSIRDALLAIYAFNAELAGIRDAVSEPILGRMRLQFWRDALNGLYAGASPTHEIAGPLGEAVRAHELDRALLEGLIDARERDLEEGGFASLAALTDYADATATPLVLLALKILGCTDSGAEPAAREAAVATALTGLMRALPVNAARGRSHLPADAGMANLSPDAYRPGPELSAAVRHVTHEAERRLAEARRLGRGMPRRFQSALLPASLAGLYLKRFRKAGGDPFAFGVQYPGAARQLTVLARAAMGRF